jgi:hypothetical protein
MTMAKRRKKVDRRTRRRKAITRKRRNKTPSLNLGGKTISSSKFVWALLKTQVPVRGAYFWLQFSISAL